MRRETTDRLAAIQTALKERLPGKWTFDEVLDRLMDEYLSRKPTLRHRVEKILETKDDGKAGGEG